MNKNEMKKYGEVSYKNRKLFLKLYLGEGWSNQKIADFFGVAKGTPSKWRIKHGINSKSRKHHREFVREVFDLVGCEYSVRSLYQRKNKKIMVKHNKCGFIYKVRPHNFLRGNRCPKCQKKYRKNTTEFEKEVRNLVGKEYSVLGDYQNSRTKIKMRHNKCDFVFKMRPTDFLFKSRRCPKCGGTMKKDTEAFRKEVYATAGAEYEVLGKYKNNRTKIKIKHNECGNIYETTPNIFFGRLKVSRVFNFKRRK